MNNEELEINTKKLVVFYKTPDSSEDILKVVEVGNDENFAEPTGFGILTEDIETEKFSINLFPALYSEHFAHLRSRIMTIIDATHSDLTQRDAVKKLINNDMNDWYHNNLKHVHKRANNAKIKRLEFPFGT